jgi:hypothetical protein
MRRVFLASMMVLSLALATSAQTFRGAINGTVTDPTGAFVPKAQVKAAEVATGIEHTTLTTPDGEFAFQDIPLGLYKVTVTAPGFAGRTFDRVEVVAGTIYTLPVKLALGQETTVVEVSAAAVSLDTTTPTQNMTISSDVVQDAPLNGRDFTQLIAVAPGYGGYSVGGFGSLNGTRPNQMNWQIDGVDNNDFWHNIPAVNQGGVSGIAGVVLPIDSIDEFSSQTQSGAEAGRNAGGTVNLVLKSGTNNLHGSVYYYDRNEFWSASSPFFVPSASNPKPPKLRNENYGLSVGGPLIKNRTFFFVAYEKQQYIIGLSGLATEPSDAWITTATDLLKNPGNKYGNYAPVSASPLSAKLIGPNGFWPRNLVGGLPATTNNFFSPIASTGYSYNGVIKVDHNFNDKNRLSARWFGGQGSQTAPLGSSTALGTASSNLQYYFEVAPIHVYNYSLVLNSVLTPHLTNQVLFGVNYFNQVFHDFNNSFDTKALGLFLSPDATDHGQPILGAPNIAISGFEQIGLTPPEGRNDVTGHLTDIVSYVAGKHQFRFGGEVRSAHVDEFYHRRGTGKFTFDGTSGPWAAACAATPTPAGCSTLASSKLLSNAEALADYLAGDVVSSTIAVGNPERFVKVNAFNFFVQDAWQLTSKLNVDFGLRYEYFGPLHSDKKDLAVFVPGKGLVIQGAGIDSIFPASHNDFAPRVGFAYQPTGTGDMVVRGGIGIFFDQINMNPFLDFRPGITAAQGLQGNPIGPSAVSTYARNGYQWDAVQAGGASIFPGVKVCTDPFCANAPGQNLFSVNQNFRVPHFANYNLQVERSLGSAAVAQVGYVGSQGRKLNVVSNINQYNAFPNFGSIIQLNSVGTSNYNALQSTLRLRSWHGLTSQIGYTWAHSLDEISEYRGAIQDDLHNLKADYGNSDFDTRHLFTVGFDYQIPGSSHGPSLLSHGWEVSTLMNFHTGQPFDEVLPLGNAASPFNPSTQYLRLLSNPFSGINHSFSAANGGEVWINPAAFCTAPCSGKPFGRNKFYGPGYGSVDLSILKTIPIRERVKVQLRAEMFNVFNRINLASGAGSVNDYTSTGLVSDTIGDFNGAPGIGPGEAFNMQLVAKIIF